MTILWIRGRKCHWPRGSSIKCHGVDFSRGCRKGKKTGEDDATHLHAYSMFDIKVAGAVVLGVSIMYATTVGNEEAIASVMIAPEADQVNISIWPGVSRMT